MPTLCPFVTVSCRVGLQSVIVAFLGHTLSFFFEINMNSIGTTYIRASELFKSDLHLGSLSQVHPVVKEILKQKGQYQG